jgi:hypothetical protein
LAGHLETRFSLTVSLLKTYAVRFGSSGDKQAKSNSIKQDLIDKYRR